MYRSVQRYPARRVRCRPRNRRAARRALRGAADPQPPKGFTALFNGRDLSGFHGLEHFDPRKLRAMSDEERAAKRKANEEPFRKHWRVENGELVNDGEGPYATTDREYGDIELLIEYRTVAKADSGIYLRGNPQVQIWDYTKEGGKGDRGAEKGSGGLWNNRAGSPGKDPLVLADKPFGEWNTLRIRQVGDKTTVHLNDKLVVDHATMENYWDPKEPLWARGPIQLQTHGGEIRWRNIFIREIPADEATRILSERDEASFTSIFNGRNFTGWAGPLDNYEIVDGAIRCKTETGRHHLHAEGVRGLRRAPRVQAAARRQQRPRDPLPGRRRCRLRRHDRTAGARQHLAEVHKARSAAVPRLRLRHGRRETRLPPARRANGTTSRSP